MTKAELKNLKQLQQKKYRRLTQSFVVEGWKSITEFLKAGFVPQKIWAVNLPGTLSSSIKTSVNLVPTRMLKQASLLKHPKDAIAVFKMPSAKKIPAKGFILALDDLQDPGNLGTIIRTADWFGFKHIVCSENTVDCYNPKVVQATMGSLAHVNLYYTNLPKYLQTVNMPVYGAFLQGENLFKMSLPKSAIVVVGNEGNGIKPQTSAFINTKITIPKAPGAQAESLNASVASAIIMQEFFRRLY